MTVRLLTPHRSLTHVSRRAGLAGSLVWRRMRAVLDAIARRFSEWRYWSSREGSQRIREARAVDAVVAMANPIHRDWYRVQIESGADRPKEWFEIPERWRR